MSPKGERKAGRETREGNGQKRLDQWSKGVGITSREAAFRTAEKQGSRSTEPGVYGTRRLMGKQWGGETGSKPRDAQERATRQHGTGVGVA